MAQLTIDPRNEDDYDTWEYGTEPVPGDNTWSKRRAKMQALVYSNGSQESERAVMVLEACGQNVREYLLGVDFSDRQFRGEFGSDAEYPQIAIGLNHRGTLKETLKYMSDKGMLV